MPATSSARAVLLSLWVTANVSLAFASSAAATPPRQSDGAQIDASQRDTDDDGASDAEEMGEDASIARDSDGDGVPDIEDRDDDGDGISSERERMDAMASGVSDVDQDGLDNWLDDDADGDGLSDADEGRLDADHNGVLGYLDAHEAGALDNGCRYGQDSDGDGVTDRCDEDADGDGIEDGLHIAGGGLMSCAASTGAAPAPWVALLALLFAVRRRGGRRFPWQPARRSVVTAVLLGGTTLSAVTAVASPAALPGERFRPAIDASGVIGVESAALPESALAFDAAVWTGYALNPLVLRTADGERRRALVGHRVSGDVVLALSVLGRVQLGVDVPVVLFQSPTLPADLAGLSAQGLSSAALGDLRLVPKVQLLREAHQLVDVAVMGAVTLPTAAPSASYQAEGDLTFSPAVLVSRSLGPVRLLANLGYRLREQRQLAGLVVGPELFYGAAAAVDVLDLPVRLDASLAGTTGVASRGANPSSLELLGGASVAFFGPFQISAGAGLGLLAGFGTPDARAFVALRYAPRHAASRVTDDTLPAQARSGTTDAADTFSLEEAAVLAARLRSLQKISFAPGRAQLTEDSLPVLDEVAQLLHDNPRVQKLRIAGHTDVEGDAVTNFALSQHRAHVVMRHLLQRGVEPERLEALGFGATRPIASNLTAEGRERNRRVELIIMELADARQARR